MNETLYVVTGASGHIGGRVADRLLAKGKQVRVVGRNPARLRGLSERGAEAVAGSVDDPQAMKRAFEGAEAAFVMIPPDYGSRDFRAWQKKVADTYSTALRAGGVRYAVSLSSVGAHLAERTGPILGLHDLENTLDAIPGLNVIHLRPAFFMENHLAGIPMIRAMGMVAGQIRADLRMPMIATRDIADVAAHFLLHLSFRGKSTRELLGQRDLTVPEATHILGAAIGKPDLKYVPSPAEAVEQAMIDHGMSRDVARLMVEMGRGFNEGHIAPVEKRSEMNTTPTSIEETARVEFATAYVVAEKNHAA